MKDYFSYISADASLFISVIYSTKLIILPVGPIGQENDQNANEVDTEDGNYGEHETDDEAIKKEFDFGLEEQGEENEEGGHNGEAIESNDDFI